MELFRKFIRFGSVTRPWKQHWMWIETQKWILTMFQRLPMDNGHRFCEETLSTAECSVSVVQWCVRITRTFYIQKIFLIVPMVSNAYQGQLIKLNKRKHAWNPSVCRRGDIFYIIWNKVHRNSLFVFCKVVVITLQPALKIASIWILYHQHTLRQKLSC